MFSIKLKNIDSIAKALAELPRGNANKNEIYEDLLAAAYEDLELVDYKVYSDKLSLLINKLGVKKSRLADAIHISCLIFPKYVKGRLNHEILYTLRKA